MKRKLSKRGLLTARIMKDGQVNLTFGRKKLAFILPEIFSEGWAKHTAKASSKVKGQQALVTVPDGTIGLKTSVKPTKNGIQVSAVLTPLSDVKIIHIRQVVNLRYNDWAGKAFRLGTKQGTIPVKPQADNKISEGKSVRLVLGPQASLGGKSLQIQAPRLQLVLQDNRQWTPFLHAFVTKGEPSEPAWIWKKGVKKEYRMNVTVS